MTLTRLALRPHDPEGMKPMQRFLRGTAILIAVGTGMALTACQSLQTGSTGFATTATATYDCDGRTVQTRFGDERVQLTLDGKDHRLPRVRSADGARYEIGKDDDHLLFWDKGDHAFLQTGTDDELDRCTQTQSHSAFERLPLEANGNEPGWNARVTQKQIRLVDQYGKRTTTVPQPDARLTDDGYRYTGKNDTHRIEVHATEQTCTDDSDRGWPLTVSVQRDSDSELKGCGGDRKRLLTGATWRVEDIAGRGLIDNSHVTLDFTDGGRLSGDTSCNRYTTHYSIDKRLQLRAIATTRRACAPALMNQEQRFLRLLGDIRKVGIGKHGALELTTSDGQTITARREDSD